MITDYLLENQQQGHSEEPVNRLPYMKPLTGYTLLNFTSGFLSASVFENNVTSIGQEFEEVINDNQEYFTGED